MEVREKAGASTLRSTASACCFCGKVNGAQGRDRTADTAIFNRMLYQLSYLGISGATGWSAGKAAS